MAFCVGKRSAEMSVGKPAAASRSIFRDLCIELKRYEQIKFSVGFHKLI